MTETAEKTATADASNTDAKPAAKPPAVRAPLQAGGAVHAIVPSTLEQAYRLAEWICGAGWAPKGYLVDYKRPELGFDPNKIAVGILHGLEVGLTPIAALQSIAVINGMPSIYGDGALALVRASGLMEDFKETPVLDESIVIGFKCWAKRKGQNTPIEQQFLKADAERAKLLEKSGPWTEYRPRMYQMRARAWLLRDGFADVLRGLSIAEEAMDIIDVTPARVPDIEQPEIEPKKPAAPQTAESAPASSNGEGATQKRAEAAATKKSGPPTLEDCKAFLNENGKEALPTLKEWRNALSPVDQVELDKLIEAIEKASKPADKPIQDGQKRIIRANLKRSAYSEEQLEAKFGKIDELKASQVNEVNEWLQANPLK